MKMKKKIYYIKKGKDIIIRGKKGQENIHILQLPKDPLQLIRALDKGSFFQRGKALEIFKKINEVDYKTRRDEDYGED